MESDPAAEGSSHEARKPEGGGVLREPGQVHVSRTQGARGVAQVGRRVSGPR